MEFSLVDDSTLSQIVLLLIAFVFSAIIGIEREFRHKNAGARTHILVGVGSALFTLVSVYGFSGMLDGDPPQDPARIAAQVVTGIGFLGAGVIFVRQSVVAGLTTAASIWVTASIGMACGAGMPLIAGVAVLLYLLSVTVMTVVVRKIREPRRERTLRFEYFDGQGTLRTILSTASSLGYTASLLNTARLAGRDKETVMKSVHVLISGLVQGVGYRYSTRQAATERGVTGWVRNLPDGRVEAEFHGSAQAVDALLAWCEQGPPAARVESVEVSALEGQMRRGNADFQII